MEYWVYVLKSKNFPRHYIGISRNPESRLTQHNSGAVKSTKFYKPWVAIYTEKCKNRAAARAREVHLKTSAISRERIFNNGAIV